MNIKKDHLKGIINSLLLVMTVVLLVIESQLLSSSSIEEIFAQAPENQPAANQQAPNQLKPSLLDEEVRREEELQCVSVMRPFMEQKREQFSIFINQHFRSKQPTSVLIPVAIERLRQYRDEVTIKMESFGPISGKAATVVTREDSACRAVVEEDFGHVKELLQNHILENAYAKKTTRLLDTYKQINEQLGALNFNVAELYANLSTFAQKLPCYAKQCQTK